MRTLGHREAKRRRAAWLAGVALAAVPSLGIAGLSGALLAALTATPALADGGAGGSSPGSNPGGAGGTGFTGNAGSNSGGEGGGGGGGAGGGAGGGTNGSVNSGGAGGTFGSPNGQNGTAGGAPSIGALGGGGGGGGYNGNGAGAATITNNSPQAGGNGGTGGAGNLPNGGDGGGGGGGAGGYGAIVTGSGASGNNSTITGGNGGAGGQAGGGTGTRGGNGGDGGVGVQFTASGASFANSGTITGGNGGAAGAAFQNGSGGSAGAGGAGVVGSGLTITNSGGISGGLGGDGVTRANAITFTGGTNVLELRAGSTITGNVVAFSAADTLALGGTANATFDVSQIGAAAQYRGFGIFAKTGSSTWTLTGTTAAVTPWTINQGTLAVAADNNLGAASGGLSFGGGTLQFLSSFTTNRTVTLNAGGGTFDTDGNNATLGGTISGAGGLTKIGAGILTLSGTSKYSGATNVNAGTLSAGASGVLSSASAFTIAAGATLTFDSNQTIGSLAGAGTVVGSALGHSLTTGGDNTSTLFSGVLTDGGAVALSLTKVGSGTFTLSGGSMYTGNTNVNAGMLDVTGSIASSFLTTVNNGAVLLGTGTVHSTQVNSGGTFAPGSGAPGTSMTLTGNLAFQSGALYLVQLNPASASFATVVFGTATLAGTVDAAFASGSYMAHQYDILHAGTVSGTFGTLNTMNLPAGFAASLSYTSTDVLLDLTAVMGHTVATAGLNGNQQNVANALNNFFNSGGTLPPNFLAVFGLTGGNLASALSQLDGEAATDAERGAFQLMTEFLGLMLDPFVAGRAGAGGGGGGGAIGFAPQDETSFPPDIALAYAGVLKAPPKPAAFDQRWTVWGSGFGGSNTTNGNAALGTNNVTTATYGGAAGMDYHFTPDTLAGFALAGAGTNWNLAQGLGGGRSDAFQAGVYGKTYFGPAYLAAALAFTNNWFTTNRVALGDQLTARFQGQSYGGRFEAGYRHAVLPALGITPYAAVQAQSFHTPAYSETDLTGGGFGLAFNAMSAHDTRSELGARFDDLTMVNAMPLILRARAAWAHDWVSNPALGAVFQALPGASFIVNGAVPPKDSALVSAGAELHLTRNWAVAAKFDGEFADHSQTYAGTGTLRYTW